MPSSYAIKLGIMAGTVCVWSAHAIVISYALKQNPDIEKVGLVLAGEALKLVFATCYHVLGESSSESSPLPARGFARVQRLCEGWRAALYLLVPALLYVFNNFLTFVNYQHFNPATYKVLINVKILFTALLMQVFFKKWLTRRQVRADYVYYYFRLDDDSIIHIIIFEYIQWVGVVLLLLGCAVGGGLGGLVASFFQPSGGSARGGIDIVGTTTLLLQGGLSSLGGVYFMWLLHAGKQAYGMWEKNVYLYFWGVVCNVLLCLASTTERNALSFTFAARLISTPSLIGVVAIGSCGGILISLLLKHLDSVMKEMASGLELFAVAALQWAILRVPLRPAILVSIVLTIFALNAYNGEGPLCASCRGVKQRGGGESSRSLGGGGQGGDESEMDAIIASVEEGSISGHEEE